MSSFPPRDDRPALLASRSLRSSSRRGGSLSQLKLRTSSLLALRKCEIPHEARAEQVVTRLFAVAGDQPPVPPALGCAGARGRLTRQLGVDGIAEQQRPSRPHRSS